MKILGKIQNWISHEIHPCEKDEQKNLLLMISTTSLLLSSFKLFSSIYSSSLSPWIVHTKYHLEKSKLYFCFVCWFFSRRKSQHELSSEGTWSWMHEWAYLPPTIYMNVWPRSVHRMKIKVRDYTLTVIIIVERVQAECFFYIYIYMLLFFSKRDSRDRYSMWMLAFATNSSHGGTYVGHVQPLFFFFFFLLFQWSQRG